MLEKIGLGSFDEEEIGEKEFGDDDEKEKVESVLSWTECWFVDECESERFEEIERE